MSELSPAAPGRVIYQERGLGNHQKDLPEEFMAPAGFWGENLEKTKLKMEKNHELWRGNFSWASSDGSLSW